MHKKSDNLNTSPERTQKIEPLEAAAASLFDDTLQEEHDKCQSLSANFWHDGTDLSTKLKWEKWVQSAILAYLRAVLDDEELRGNVAIAAHAAAHPGEAVIQALIDHIREPTEKVEDPAEGFFRID